MKIIAVKVFQLKQLKRRNLKKFRLERELSGKIQAWTFKPEYFQVSSFQLFKLKHLHCDDLHKIQTVYRCNLVVALKCILRPP